MSVRINRLSATAAGVIFLLSPVAGSANTAPEIIGTPDTTVNIGQEYRFQPTTSDADGDALNFVMRRQPDWLSFDTTTGELRGTPALADVGLHKRLLIMVKDGTDDTKLPLFSIEVINPPPAISGTPVTSLNSGAEYRFTPTASDPNGDELTYSVINKPNWASFNSRTGELKGTPNTNKTRNYRDIVISVSDGMSTVSLPAFGIAAIAGEYAVDCTGSTQTSSEFACQLPTDGVKDFALVDPPRGFSIQPKTGLIHWTPTADQVGEHYIGVVARGGDSTKWIVSVNVAQGLADPAGIYVTPDGDDSAAGTATTPLRSIKQAAKMATKGDTIYLRGGVYYNDEYGQPYANRTAGSMARITTSGTSVKPITIRPHGNEYVKLVSDVSVLQFKNARHWIVEGLEFEGMTQFISKDEVMSLWWEEGTEPTKKITARGISTNASQHITVRNNVIHDFPGAGVGNNGSDMITVENNVIYHTGWWSTAGTHGVSNSYLTTVPGNEGRQALTITGNLVFGNQSRVISHVFSKGNVDLAIDEGNGLHAQNNSETFFGKALIQNNLLMFNGKSGFGINTMNAVRVKNNAFYQNAQVVDTGELSVQASVPTAINNNLFQPLPHRRTLKDSNQDYSLMNNNASTYGIDAVEMPVTTLFASVFSNPAELDFSPTAWITADMGVPQADLQRMLATVNEYGIEVKNPQLEAVDTDYLMSMKQAIFSSWPASLSHLTLTDRDSKIIYTYAQRCTYPGVPTTVCQ